MALPSCVFCAFEGRKVYGTDFYGVLLCNLHRGVVQRAFELKKYLERDAAKVYCPHCEQPIERPVISNPVVASVGSALAGAAVVYVAFSCPNCHTALSFAIVSSRSPVVPMGGRA